MQTAIQTTSVEALVKPSIQNRAPIKTQNNIALCGELPVTATIIEPDAEDRKAHEAFVQAMFSKVHQAEITHFMPTLLSLRDANQQLRAVCGLRHAHQEALFLERYLEMPIESVLSQHTGHTVARHEILEIGNLAVSEPACIRSLLASVSVYLHKTDAKWVVFTGITSLRNTLVKLQMPLFMLGEAKISCLPKSEHASWGRYYEQRPQVLAIPRLN